MTEQRIRHPLTHIRAQHGWSLEILARLLTLAAQRRGLRYAPGRDRVWKWEARGEIPSLDYQLLLADVLGLPEQVLEVTPWPGWLPAFDTPRPFTQASSRTVLTEILMPQPPDRRAFLAYTTSALLGLTHAWLQAPPLPVPRHSGGHHVDGELVDWLERSAEDLAGLSSRHPAADRLLEVHLQTCVDLISHGTYPQATGRRLHAITARVAQTSAWRLFDQGLHAAAQKRWHTALHAAHHTGHPDLGAVVVGDLAYQCTWLDDPATAARLLEQARTRASAPALASLIDLRTARALARMRDDTGTERALAASERHLEHADPASTPAEVAWMGPADLHADAGRCHLDLGNPAEADQSFEEGLAELDPARERTRAVFETYRAEAALADRDIERAAHYAKTAHTTAVAAGADRCTATATGLVRRLRAEHAEHPAVRELTAT